VPIAASLGTIVALAIIGVIVWLVAFRDEEDPKPTPGPVAGTGTDPNGGGTATPVDPLEEEASVFYRVQSDNLIAGRFSEVASVIAATKGRYASTKVGEKIAKLESEAKKRLAEKSADDLVAKARGLRREGALDKAMDTVVLALANVPDHAGAKAELAEIKAAMADGEARPGRELAAKIEKLMVSAGTMRDAGLHEKALEKLTEVLALDGNHAEARVMVAQIKKDLENKRATEQREAQYRKWMDQGTSLRLAGDYEKAAEAFERAVKFAPPGSTEAADSVRAARHDHYRARARVARAAERREEAIEHLLKALEFKADPAVSAEIAAIRKEIDEARVAERRRADADKWRKRAEDAVANGRLKEALGLYREAKKYGAPVDEAIVLIEKQLNQTSQPEPATAVDRAQELVAANKLEEAMQVLRAHLQENPDDAKAAELLGEVSQQAAPQPDPVIEIQLPNRNKIQFVYIKPGSFMMGSADGLTDEQPVRRVTISKGYYLGRYEVTKAQYYSVMRTIRLMRDPHNPADSISWQEALTFCSRLSKMSGRRIRLPTEAEWEYACKAGQPGRYPGGNDSATLDQYAWFKTNSRQRTQPVGQKKPNPWGLYDMFGNVCEWCSDAYSQDYYKQGATVDPRGPATGNERVLRGGCVHVDANVTTATARYHTGQRARSPIAGLRVVAEIGAPENGNR
jgi:formylglycine-generating enzyme required for sulfatase activity